MLGSIRKHILIFMVENSKSMQNPAKAIWGQGGCGTVRPGGRICDESYGHLRLGSPLPWAPSGERTGQELEKQQPMWECVVGLSATRDAWGQQG